MSSVRVTIKLQNGEQLAVAGQKLISTSAAASSPSIWIVASAEGGETLQHLTSRMYLSVGPRSEGVCTSTPQVVRVRSIHRSKSGGELVIVSPLTGGNSLKVGSDCTFTVDARDMAGHVLPGTSDLIASVCSTQPCTPSTGMSLSSTSSSSSSPPTASSAPPPAATAPPLAGPAAPPPISSPVGSSNGGFEVLESEEGHVDVPTVDLRRSFAEAANAARRGEVEAAAVSGGDSVARAEGGGVITCQAGHAVQYVVAGTRRGACVLCNEVKAIVADCSSATCRYPVCEACDGVLRLSVEGVQAEQAPTADGDGADAIDTMCDGAEAAVAPPVDCATAESTVGGGSVYVDRNDVGDDHDRPSYDDVSDGASVTDSVEGQCQRGHSLTFRLHPTATICSGCGKGMRAETMVGHCTEGCEYALCAGCGCELGVAAACQNGHRLVTVQRDVTTTCDGCSVTMQPRTTLARCRDMSCDFDLCEVCVEGLGVVGAEASVGSVDAGDTDAADAADGDEGESVREAGGGGVCPSQHPLTLTVRKYNYHCDRCYSSHTPGVVVRCSNVCDFDLCVRCGDAVGVDVSAVDVDGKVVDDGVACALGSDESPACPDGHAMEERVQPLPCMCNRCGISMRPHSTVVRCAYTCDYELCLPCGAAMKAPLATATLAAVDCMVDSEADGSDGGERELVDGLAHIASELARALPAALAGVAGGLAAAAETSLETQLGLDEDPFAAAQNSGEMTLQEAAASDAEKVKMEAKVRKAARKAEKEAAREARKEAKATAAAAAAERRAAKVAARAAKDEERGSSALAVDAKAARAEARSKAMVVARDEAPPSGVSEGGDRKPSTKGADRQFRMHLPGGYWLSGPAGSRVVIEDGEDGVTIRLSHSVGLDK